MDVVADIALLADEWRTCMDADAHADRPSRARRSVNSEAAASAPGAVGNATKKASPCVSTSTPPLSGTCVPDHCPVLGERLRVGLCAELVQQRRRAFDIGEEEGDGAGRKLGAHAWIIRRCRGPATCAAQATFPQAGAAGITSLEESVRVGHNHDSGRSVHRVTLSSSDVAAIRSARKALADAFEASDPTAWVDYYTEDAIFVGPGVPAIEGRDALLVAARAVVISSMEIVADSTLGAETSRRKHDVRIR